MLDSIAAARFARGMPITRALLESWSRPPAKPRASPRPAHAEGQRTNASGGMDGGGGGGNRRGGGVHGWRSFRLDKFSVVGSNSPRNQVHLRYSGDTGEI